MNESEQWKSLVDLEAAMMKLAEMHSNSMAGVGALRIFAVAIAHLASEVQALKDRESG
jgi:hypothetical protein